MMEEVEGHISHFKCQFYSTALSIFLFLCAISLRRLVRLVYAVKTKARKSKGLANVTQDNEGD